MVLQLVDLNVVPERHHKVIKDILDREYDVIKSQNSAINGLRVHFKAHDSGEGPNKKYSVHFLVDVPGRPIVIDKNSVDWDPIIALNKGIETLEFKIGKEKHYEK